MWPVELNLCHLSYDSTSQYHINLYVSNALHNRVPNMAACAVLIRDSDISAMKLSDVTEMTLEDDSERQHRYSSNEEVE